VLPISDKIIKATCGKTVNFIEMPNFSFGKEMQLHVMEIKANQPFNTPAEFEETMQNAVNTLNAIVEKHGAMLLGTGMHPILDLRDTAIWPHYHKKIYQQYGKIFNINQHGWLNIQSFHLNLPYQREVDAIQIHNHLANLCAYLPAVAASSPIYEGKVGEDTDNRLQFYKINQKEIPSISADVVPEYISSFNQYKQNIIGKYSYDLAKLGAEKALLQKEWVNSRGVILRFDRCAIEVRVMDEQECIKSDVAMACFVRSALKGLIASEAELLPHDLLVQDFNEIIKYGLSAKTQNPHGRTAQQVCRYLFKIATENADNDEKEYLWLAKRRVEEGNLSQIIRTRVMERSKKTSMHEAILDVYLRLIKCLQNNEPYI